MNPISPKIGGETFSQNGVTGVASIATVVIAHVFAGHGWIGRAMACFLHHRLVHQGGATTHPTRPAHRIVFPEMLLLLLLLLLLIMLMMMLLLLMLLLNSLSNSSYLFEKVKFYQYTL